MSGLALERPAAVFRDSYCDLVDEFTAAREKLVPFTLSFPHDDFTAFLRRLDGCSKGIGLPQGFVPHSTYWLVRDRKDVVGVSNIRHRLTEALRREGGNIGYGIRPSARRRGYAKAILQMSLVRATELGLSRILLTCAKSNVGSIKTILSVGGVFHSEEFLEDRGEVVQRYWIENGSGSRA